MDKALNVIINHWGETFTKCYGHIFPESYLCIDLEYTGFNAQKDLIWEIGHVLVENRVVVDQLSVVLDWTNHPVIPGRWLREAISRSNLRMQEYGKPTALSWDLLAEEGLEPNKVLDFYFNLITKARKRGLCLVGHNGYSTDERMLVGHFEGFLQKRFVLGDNELFDTGAIEKATLVVESGVSPDKKSQCWWLPRDGDTLRAYFSRVCHHPAKGIHWNLMESIQRYGLDKKHDLDMTKCHRADFDAYLCHLLMEEFRSRISVSHAKENIFLNSETLQRGFEQEIARLTEEQKQVAVKEAEEEIQTTKLATAPKGFRSARRRGQRPI